MQNLTFINKNRSVIKVFEPLKIIQTLLSLSLMQFFDFLLLCSNRTRKAVIKGSMIEYIEEARNEYKKLLEEGWGNHINSIVFLKDVE